MLSALKKSASPGKKHVTFAEGVKEEETTSFFRAEKKPRFSAIRKLWFQYAENNEYEQLKQYLVSCTQKGIVIEDFFSKEGGLILFWAINFPSATALEFMCDNIPSNIIQCVLTQNDDILQSFLLGQSGLDKHNRITLEHLNVRIEKFELLLNSGYTNTNRRQSIKKSKFCIRKVLYEFL